MFPYLRLGPYLLQLSGLALLVGFWLGLSVSESEARRRNVRSSDVYNMAFYAAVSGVLGARLVYAARYLDAYLQNPSSLFALNTNTISPWGGLITGVVVAFAYGKWKGMPLRPTLDVLAPGMAVLQVLIAVAHFLNGEAYGAPAQLPWSIYLWSEYRHPSQVYEFLAAVIILAVVLRSPWKSPEPGWNFLLFIALSAGARLFLEAFRGDSLVWPGGFRAGQVIGLLILLAALLLMRKWKQETGNEPDLQNQQIHA